MNTLLDYYLFLLILGFQPEGPYERHNQSCGSMDGTDVKWSLDIKPSNTYTLSITKRTNDYLQKPKETFTVGIWKSHGDTLKLYQWGDTKKRLTFYQKDDKLLFQKATLPFEAADLLYLDYLQKAPK